MNDEIEPSALSAVRKVNLLLAPMLVELYGDVRAAKAADTERVIESYTVEDYGFHCRIGLAINNEIAATLTVVIRVGRFYRGYRQALRWLANNRSSNTVSIAFEDHHAQTAELWVCCTRITAPGDSAGLREALNDIHRELGAVDAGLRLWFPQVLRGQMLTNLEEAAQGDDGLRALLASPHAFLDGVRGHSEHQLPGELIEDAYGWLRRWDEQLREVDRAACEADRDRKDHLWERTRSLLELQRWNELLRVCRQLEEVADERDHPMLAGVLGNAHYELGEFEDVLDVLRSATLDGTPRVCLYRALAHAKLGHAAEAMDAYAEYDRIVGKDIIATRMLAAAMPDPDGF